MKRFYIMVSLFMSVGSAFPQTGTAPFLNAFTYTFDGLPDSTFTARQERSFDEKGRLATDAYYFLNSFTKKWQGSYYDRYKWNEQGKLTWKLRLDWDWDSSKWQDSYRQEKSYDRYGNISEEADYYWYSNLYRWIGGQKRAYLWDPQGRISQEIYYKMPYNTTDWAPDSRTEHTYNSSGNEVIRITRTWSDPSGWSDNTRTETQYNQNGKKTLESNFLNNSDVGGWQLYYTTAYFYDDLGLLTSVEGHSNHNYLNFGAGNYKEEYTNDQAGNRILTYYSNWDSTVSDWVRIYRYEYAFDENKHLLLNTASVMDSAQSGWNYLDKYEYTYDNNGNLTESLSTDWDWNDFSIFHMFRTSNFYDRKGLLVSSTQAVNGTYYSDWSVLSKTYYGYKPAAHIEYTGTVKVYPNPFTSILHIGLPDDTQYNRFEIFDLNGKRLVETGDRTIDLSSLGSGTYILRVTDKAGVTQALQKIIRQK
jgi:hypothetical protein